MADLDQATLDSPELQQQAARELRRQQFAELKTGRLPTAKATTEENTFGRPEYVKQADRQARLQGLRSARKTIERVGSTTPGEELQAQLSSVALQAYTRLWQQGHELVEGLAFQFFMVGAFLVAPIADLMFGARLLIGKAMNGGFQIEFQGISVPAVPDISAVESAYRGGKLIFISLIGLLEWAIIVVTIQIVTHPTDAIKLGFQAIVQALGLAGSTTPSSGQ